MKEIQRLKHLKKDTIVIINNECYEELNKVSLQVNTFSATLKLSQTMKDKVISRYKTLSQTDDFTQIECDPFDLYCYIKSSVEFHLTPSDFIGRFEILKSKLDYSILGVIGGLTWDFIYEANTKGLTLHIESNLTPEMVKKSMKAFYNISNIELIKFFGFATGYLNISIIV